MKMLIPQHFNTFTVSFTPLVSLSCPNITHLSCVCLSRNCLTVGRSKESKSIIKTRAYIRLKSLAVDLSKVVDGVYTFL